MRASIVLGALGLAATIVGCSRSHPPVEAGPTTHVEVSAADGFRMTHTVRSGEQVLRRVDLHVDQGVDYDYRTGTHWISVSGAGGEVTDAEASTGLVVQGQEVEVGGDQLVIGERELGPIADGSKVEFREDGVFVDGERRGELEP